MKTTRRILSLVLAMIMLLSAFSVVASAREIEIAQSGVTMTGGEVLYLKPNSNWTKDGARFAAYFFGTGDGWASMETCPRDAGYYKVTVPTGSWTNVIFCRMNPASTKNDWNSKWNQSADLVYDGTNNLFTVASGSWDGAKTTWSKWSETPAPTEPPVTEPEVVETEPEATQPEVVETEPEETQPEAGTMKIYFQNNWMWSDVSIYYWGVENAPQWPGNKMEKFGNDGTYDIYVAEVPTNVEGLLINGVKDDGSGQLDKTPDIKDAKDGNCYFMLWDNGNAVDFKDISEILPDPTQPEETEPEETQPEETQPEETQPEETQPEETQPEETQPEETQPEVKVEKVTGLNATDVTRDSFTLTWDAIDGAKKYWVYVNGVIYNSTTENTITVTKRDVGTEYTVFITAYVNDYITKADAAESITVTTLDYEYACDVTSGTYSIDVAWDAVDCTKAWVYIGTDPENLKIYNSSKTGELTITGLESNTAYYVKVTYLIDGYIVEDTEIFDIATTADEALFITAEVVEDGIAVDWNALDGATKYWVTYETAEKTLVYSTTNDEFVIPNGKEDCTISVKAAVNQKMVYFYSVDL